MKISPRRLLRTAKAAVKSSGSVRGADLLRVPKNKKNTRYRSTWRRDDLGKHRACGGKYPCVDRYGTVRKYRGFPVSVGAWGDVSAFGRLTS